MRAVLLLLPTPIPTPLPMMTDVQILILLLLQDTLRQHGNELVVLQTQDSSRHRRENELLYATHFATDDDDPLYHRQARELGLFLTIA